LAAVSARLPLRARFSVEGTKGNHFSPLIARVFNRFLVDKPRMVVLALSAAHETQSTRCCGLRKRTDVESSLQPI
jgi:hypothetical protein